MLIWFLEIDTKMEHVVGLIPCVRQGLVYHTLITIAADGFTMQEMMASAAMVLI